MRGPTASSEAPPKPVTLGTHRPRPLSETLAALRALMPAMGITRLANVTGLDRIGIPVVMSVRPASRGLSVQQGKGLSLEAAMVSGLMESVESFAAEQRCLAPVPRGRRLIALPAHALRADLPDAATFPCVQGQDLLTGDPVLVPEEMVRFDATLPRPPAAAWFRATTNGLAAGNTRNEALLHALCELIERDAEALWKRLPRRHRDARRFDPGSLDDAGVAWLLARFHAAGIAVSCWDITSDIGVPCIACEIEDRDSAGAYLGRHAGSGCHPSAAIAACRALSEAAQSRLTDIAGTRDDLGPECHALTEWDRAVARVVFERDEVAPNQPPRFARSFATASIDADLDAVLRRVRAAGIGSAVWVDLTAAALGVPCVRVIAPDLELPARISAERIGPRAIAAWA